MRAVAGLVEIELGAADDDFLTESDEVVEHLSQVHQFRAAAIEGEHVNAETGL